MNKSIREFPKLVVMGLVCLGMSNFSVAGNRPDDLPNIVFFLVDDFGKGALQSMGSDLHETPNIDRLAESGMRFTDGYAACTVCSPSRAAILTGRYPGRTHITNWIPGNARKNAKLKIPDWQMYMEHDWLLLPEALKKSGYTTGFFGKWHLMPGKDKKGMPEHFPTNHGFDVNIGGREWGHPKGRGKYFHPFEMPNVESKPGDYLTDRLTDYAVDFIQKNSEAPFLLYFSYYTVHRPIMGRPDLVEKYKRKLATGEYDQSNPAYAAMVESLDMSVGRVMTALEDRGLEKNTIVIFTGDNGAAFHAYTGGFRNHKGFSHEGGVREPLIFSWPGVIKGGTTSDVPMTGTDYYPTLLDLAGLPLEKDQHVDGISLAPVLRGETAVMPERSLFWHYPHYHRTTPYGAVRKGKWKLIEFFEDGALELYDLEKDREETTNLVESEPEVAKVLLQELKDWRTSVDAQMPTPAVNAE